MKSRCAGMVGRFARWAREAAERSARVERAMSKRSDRTRALPIGFGEHAWFRADLRNDANTGSRGGAEMQWKG